MAYFLSYSRKDIEVANALVEILDSADVPLFLDTRDIGLGDRWDSSVQSALRASKGVIVLLSPDAAESEHVLDEVAYALDAHKLVVPVIVRACEVPLRLRRLEWLQFDGDFNVLANRIRTLLKRGATRAAAHGVARPDEVVDDPSHKRQIRIVIGAAMSTKEPTASVLADAIARYVSWQGWPFRALKTSERDPREDRHSADYLVDVNVAKVSRALRAGWQVRTSETGEIVLASSCVEPARDFHRKHDRIAEMICEGVLRGITDHELRHYAECEPGALGYGQLLLKADQFSGMDRSKVAERDDLLRRAIALEPRTGIGHARLAGFLSWKVMNGVSSNADADASTANQEAQLAHELDPNDPHVLLSVGLTYCRIGHFQRGLPLLRRSFSLAPTVRAKNELATSLCFAGEPEEAIGFFKEILETMPAGHTFRYGRLAIALTQAGRIDEALEYSTLYVLHFPADYFGWVVHANLLAQYDREEEGRRAFEEARRLVPNLALDTVIARIEAAYGRVLMHRRHMTVGLNKLQGCAGPGSGATVSHHTLRAGRRHPTPPPGSSTARTRRARRTDLH